MGVLHGFTLASTTLALIGNLAAQAPAARHKEGASRGFLVLRDAGGHVVAAGDLVQTVQGKRINARLTFHFKDGSLDDEETVLTQDTHFHIITDHHVQRGPSFPHPEDVSFDTAAQQVISRNPEKPQDAPKAEHFDIPPDIANGIVFTLVKNLRRSDPAFSVPYLAFTGKPRVVQLEIAPEGEEPFRIGARSYRSERFAIHIRLGGLTGVVAPVVGKQPSDLRVWIVEGTVPAVVRVDAPFYVGGPVWSIQLATPSW